MNDDTSYCRTCTLRIKTVRRNDDGVCSPCTSHHARQWDWGRETFVDALGNYVGKGRHGYDVLVPVSGGKDSMFALYCATKLVSGARVMAFAWDHGFGRDRSWENIKRAMAAANIPLSVYRIGDVEEARLLYLASHRVAGFPCAACFWFETPIILRAALQHGTPVILWGAAPGQFGRGADVGVERFVGEFVGSRAGLARRLEDLLAMVMTGGRAGVLASEFSAPFDLASSLGCAGVGDAMSLGDYFDWNQAEDHVVSLLGQEFGFVKPEDMMSHTSCTLVRHRGWWEHMHRPAARPSWLEWEVAAMVRSGALSREAGFAELRAHGCEDSPPLEAIHEFCRVVGIHTDEYLQYARQPLDELSPMSFSCY